MMIFYDCQNFIAGIDDFSQQLPVDGTTFDFIGRIIEQRRI